MTKHLPLLLLVLLAAYQIWPVLQKPKSAFAWGGDDAIITWQLNRTIQKIPYHLDILFQGNIFYPYPNTLAYTMLLVPSAFIGYFPVLLSGNPVAAYNAALIFSQFSSLLIIYYWLTQFTKNRWSALLGSLVFAFSQIRLYFDVHIHMFIMQWLLLSTYFIWKFTKDQKPKYLYLASIFFSFQVWESIYQAYWILIIGFFLLLPHFSTLKRVFNHAILAIFLAIVLVLPVIGVYASIYQEFGNTSSIREAANFSMSLNDLWGKFLSPGLYICLFMSLIIVCKLKIENFKFPKWLWFLLITGVVLALGPVLKWHDTTLKIFSRIFIPLPYAALFYVLPGLSYLRSVHRYIWISAFSASFIIAFISARLPRKFQITLIPLMIILSLIGGATVKRDREFPPPDQYPAVYSWLKNQPGRVILEFPVYTWIDGPKHGLEMYRMVYSLSHGKNLIGGASGFMPPDRGNILGKIIANYPSRILNQQLADLGVNYVIIHKNEMSLNQNINITKNIGLSKIWENQDSAVYLVSNPI